jgi:hypothetical protein
MPKYLNAGESIETQGLRLEKNDPVSTYQWLAVLPTDVTKLSDAPFVDPVIYSAKITGATTYRIPDAVTGNYKISIYATTGAEATFKLSTSDGVARIIGALDKYEIMCGTRTVDSVIFTAVTGSVYFTVEKI